MSDQNAPTASAIVTLVDGIPMTTTLAIAKGAEVDHASVIKLVRTYLLDLEEFGRVGFEIQPFSTPGGIQNREIARLNEQQSTLLFTYMRNSEIVRAFKKRLVKEFYVLAGRNAMDPMQVLNDPAAMRGLLLTYTEKVIALEEQVTVLQPKADVLDQISASPGSLTITQAAKELGRHVKWLTQWMHAHRWIYRTNGSWVGYDAHIKNGDLEFKQAKYTDQNGTTQLKPYCHITQQGMVKLARLMHREAA